MQRYKHAYTEVNCNTLFNTVANSIKVGKPCEFRGIDFVDCTFTGDIESVTFTECTFTRCPFNRTFNNNH